MKNALLVTLCLIILLATAGCALEHPPSGQPVEQPPVDQPEADQPDPAPADRIALPEEQKEVREIGGLVLLSDLDESLIIELKYATADNFIGRPVYPVAVAALKRETAERLVEANRIFRQDGYTIKVWDAYRPLSVQQLLWDAYPDPNYVIKPQIPPAESDFRARHNNGMAVDITLVGPDGRELEMSTGFDDFSERAAPDYPFMTDAAKQNVNYLIAVMESVGFKNPPTEWWHFNDLVGTPTQYLDIPLEAFLD